MAKKKKGKRKRVGFRNALVPVNSKEELEKVLAVQKVLSDSARNEIMNGSLAPAKFVKLAARTLEKYARYPTLTEYKLVPALAHSEKWGATFGVTALVGALVLDHARQIFLSHSDLRLEYLQFLDTLADSSKGSISMDQLTRVFAMLSESYGIVWTNGVTMSLTVAGKRVYLHMLDAVKFVEEVALATRKFGGAP